MRRVAASLFILLALILVACGGAPSSADTGSGSGNDQPATAEGGGQEQAAEQAANEARHKINKDYEVNGLKITIGEVVVQKDRVIVGMTVNNPGKEAISFYPDMEGTVVIGDMQLDANPFLTEGKVSGEIQGGVKQEGVVHFLAPEGKELAPAEVKEIKLNLGEIIHQGTWDAKEFNETIKLGG